MKHIGSVVRVVLLVGTCLTLLAACGVGGILAASGGGGGGGGGTTRRPPPPTVEANRPVGLQQSNFVTFSFLLRDPQVKRSLDRPGGVNDPRVDVQPQFRIMAGAVPGPWTNMTEANLTPSEGTRGLALGQHTFVWNAIADIGADIFSIQIQVLAEYEPTAGIDRRFRLRGVEDSGFTLDNRLAATVFGADVRPPDDIDTFPVDIEAEAGSFLVASIGAGIVERVDSTGTVRRVVGFGIPGQTGDGGRPDLARLQLLLGIARDAAGNIYTQNSTAIRVSVFQPGPLQFGPLVFQPGTIRTAFTDLTDARGLVVHPQGVVLFIAGARTLLGFNTQDPADNGSTSVVLAGVSIAPGTFGVIAGGAGVDLSDGVPAPQAAFGEATLLDIGPLGEIYVGDPGSRRVRVINPGVADITLGGRIIGAGTIDTVAGDGSVFELRDGGPARSAGLGSFAGLSVSADRELYIADTSNTRVRLVNLGNNPSAFAGTTVAVGDIDTVVGGGDGGIGSPARSLQLNRPNTVEVDADGDLLIADQTSVLLVNGGTTGVTKYGISAAAGRSARAYEASNRGGVPLDSPRGMISTRLDRGGSVLFFSDLSAVRFLNLSSDPQTFGAGSAAAGEIGLLAGGPAPGFSGDGGSARSAGFSEPSALALDGENRLYVADTGNNRIRLINAGPALIPGAENVLGKTINRGAVATVIGGGMGPLPGDGDGLLAAQVVLSRPEGVAVGPDGLVYVADTGNHRIRVANTSLATVTVAGTDVAPGTVETILGSGLPGNVGDGADLSAVDTPTSVAIDNFGMLYVAEAGLALDGPALIRMINTTAAPLTVAGITVPPGEIRTLAGNGTRGNDGDNLVATQAQLDQPTGLHVQSLATPDPVALYFADRAQHIVRMINLTDFDLVANLRSDGAQGLAVPPASIVTLAGGPNEFQLDNRADFAGDGGEAIMMRFNAPSGVAVTTVPRVINGDTFNLPAHFFVADTRNNRIRRFGAPPIAIVR